MVTAASVSSATLTRFRVAAYVVGVGLVLLMLVAMPYRLITGDPLLTTIIGPLHGFLYIGYLALAFDLAVKCKWSIKGTLLVLLAGTVPFLSFVAERWVTRKVTEGVRI